MKIEKGLSEIITTILLIFMTIVAVGIIWVVISNVVNQPQFTITKEECKLEKEVLTMKHINLSEANLSSLKDNPENIVYECHYHGCWILNWTTKEVCEQKEVDYSYIYNLKINETDTILQDLIMLAFLDMKPKDKLIWLDENCECLDGHNPCIFYKRECEFECLKYSCGEYIIEVKR